MVFYALHQARLGAFLLDCSRPQAARAAWQFGSAQPGTLIHLHACAKQAAHLHKVAAGSCAA